MEDDVPAGTARADVAARVLAELPTITAELVDAIRAEVPAYRALTPDQLREVGAIAAWAVERIVTLWARDGQLDEADLRRFRGIGAARALDGRPLDGVLRAYRLAGARLTDLLTESTGPGRAPLTVADAIALARLWMRAVDELSDALYAGYSAAADRLAADRGRARAELLDDLLSGRRTTLTAVHDRARQLGIELPRRVRLLVHGGEVAAEPVGGPLLERRTEQERVALLTSEQEVVGLDGACYLGPAVPLPELAGQLELAHLVLRRRPRDGRTRPLDAADAQVVACLTGHRQADVGELPGLALGPLVTPAQAHLREALEGFLTRGTAGLAGQALGLHEQTVRYRLRRARALTGRDPHDPWDAFVLRAALLAAARDPG